MIQKLSLTLALAALLPAAGFAAPQAGPPPNGAAPAPRPGGDHDPGRGGDVHRLDFHPALRVGLDLIHWTTDYIGPGEGEANRLDLYAVYTF